MVCWRLWFRNEDCCTLSSDQPNWRTWRQEVFFILSIFFFSLTGRLLIATTGILLVHVAIYMYHDSIYVYVLNGQSLRIKFITTIDLKNVLFDKVSLIGVINERIESRISNTCFELSILTYIESLTVLKSYESYLLKKPHRFEKK